MVNKDDDNVTEINNIMLYGAHIVNIT